MQAKLNGAVQYILLALAVVFFGLYLFNLGSVQEVPTAEEIASLVVVPGVANVNIDNLTADVAQVQATLDEEDTFEALCKDLALEELENRDYRDLFEFLDDTFGDIDDRDDIDRVIVKDVDVSSLDVDDEDCDVLQEIKVYYEDLNGTDVKRYIDVDTVIEEGEVEDQDFTVA